MRERTRRAGPRLAAALVLLGLSAGVAAAQSEPSPATPPGNNPVPDTGVPPKTGTLSDQLSRSEGVIQPPSASTVDPGMVKSAPDAGAPMIVIPPPGSPGGDPNVRPK